jgi:hypothetical protein
MKPAVGEFLLNQAGKLSHANFEDQIALESWLAVLECQLCEEIDLNRIETGERQLRDMENVLLRYEDPQQWCNFLQGLAQRRGWWDRDKKCVRDKGVPEWARSLWKWLYDTPGMPDSHHPVDKALQTATGVLAFRRYENDTPPKEFGDLTGSWEKAFRAAALRQFLCRWVRRGFYD